VIRGRLKRPRAVMKGGDRFRENLSYPCRVSRESVIPLQGAQLVGEGLGLLGLLSSHRCHAAKLALLGLHQVPVPVQLPAHNIAFRQTTCTLSTQ